jgi:hypothetical protein
MNQQKLNIQKSIIPSARPKYNEWTETFNFGAAYDRATDKNKFVNHDLNKDYDFSKLFNPASQSFLSKIINFLKLA